MKVNKIIKLIGKWNKAHKHYYPMGVIMKTTDYTLELEPTRNLFYTDFVGYLIENGITEFMIMTRGNKPIIVIHNDVKK